MADGARVPRGADVTLIGTSGETLRNWVTWLDHTPDADHYWVGSAPRLATADAGTSYARMRLSGSVSIIAPTVDLAPFTLDPDGAVTGIAQVQLVSGAASGSFDIFLSDGASYVFGTTTATANSWQTITTTFDPVELGYIVSLAASGSLQLGVIGDYASGSTSFEVSYLALDVGGPVPLRLMQRGDGLGMGSGRVFGAGTRQNSTRVFGAL